MQRGEVWWVAFDPAGNHRSNNAANRNLSRVIVVLLTSKPQQVYPMMAALNL